MKGSLVNSKWVSVLLRAILAVLTAFLVLLIFYIYSEGAWRDTLLYYRYFFNFKRLQVFISSFGPYAAVIFIMLQAMQVIFAPIPGEVTGFVGGLLFGKLMGTLYSTIGLTLGSLVAFSIARTFGAGFVRKVVKKEYITRFDHFITHKGLFITWILFLIPGFPKDSLCYLLGLTHMRYLDFILMNVFGRLPGTLILGLEGDAVRNAKYDTFSALLIGSTILLSVLYLTRNQLMAFFTRLGHLLVERKKDNQER